MAIMKITDFETNRDLRDVEIVLTREEAEEMLACLQCLVTRPSVSRFHLTQLCGTDVAREIAVALADDGLRATPSTRTG